MSLRLARSPETSSSVCSFLYFQIIVSRYKIFYRFIRARTWKPTRTLIFFEFRVNSHSTRIRSIPLSVRLEIILQINEIKRKYIHIFHELVKTRKIRFFAFTAFVWNSGISISRGMHLIFIIGVLNQVRNNEWRDILASLVSGLKYWPAPSRPRRVRQNARVYRIMALCSRAPTWEMPAPFIIFFSRTHRLLGKGKKKEKKMWTSSGRNFLGSLYFTSHRTEMPRTRNRSKRFAGHRAKVQKP